MQLSKSPKRNKDPNAMRLRLFGQQDQLWPLHRHDLGGQKQVRNLEEQIQLIKCINVRGEGTDEDALLKGFATMPWPRHDSDLHSPS